MLNEDIRVGEYFDFNPRLNEALESLGYYILVELGYKSYPWSLLQAKPYSEGLAEYVTHSRVATGSARTVGDAFFDALMHLCLTENSNLDLFWELLNLT